ncbi:MAG: hypothetical protein HWN69_03085 [Desulfobacterales bacterium]|nr:hypothetical protein [Desulfobacterales bacterium]
MYINITDTDISDYIRQQQAGQFRRAADSKKPFAYVNNQKLVSAKDQTDRSVYIKTKKITTRETGLTKSDFPRLFDSDPGIKVSAGKISKTDKEEKPLVQYDKTGKETEKAQDPAEKETFVDQWA